MINWVLIIYILIGFLLGIITNKIIIWNVLRRREGL